MASALCRCHLRGTRSDLAAPGGEMRGLIPCHRSPKPRVPHLTFPALLSSSGHRPHFVPFSLCRAPRNWGLSIGNRLQPVPPGLCPPNLQIQLQIRMIHRLPALDEFCFTVYAQSTGASCTSDVYHLLVYAQYLAAVGPEKRANQSHSPAELLCVC